MATILSGLFRLMTRTTTRRKRRESGGFFLPGIWLGSVCRAAVVVVAREFDTEDGAAPGRFSPKSGPGGRR